MEFNNARRAIGIPRNLLFSFNCCITPQSDIARVRIDRSLIGGPTDFRHICHLGSGDLVTSSDVTSINSLLNSKGDGSQGLMAVPEDFRAKDIPVVSITAS